MCACLFPSAVRFLRLLAETQGYSKLVTRLVVDAADNVFCKCDARLAGQLSRLEDDAAVSCVLRALCGGDDFVGRHAVAAHICV